MSFSENSNSKKPWSDDEDSGDRPKRRGRRARANGPRRQHPTVIRLSKQNSTESNEPIVMAASDPTDSNSSTPPAVVAAAPTSERPIRTAAANATAISEAQTDNKVNGGNKNKNMLGRKKKSGPIASRISGLDLLYDTTMDCIEGIVTNHIPRNGSSRKQNLPLRGIKYLTFYSLEQGRDRSHGLCKRKTEPRSSKGTCSRRALDVSHRRRGWQANPVSAPGASG